MKLSWTKLDETESKEYNKVSEFNLKSLFSIILCLFRIITNKNADETQPKNCTPCFIKMVMGRGGVGRCTESTCLVPERAWPIPKITCLFFVRSGRVEIFKKVVQTRPNPRALEPGCAFISRPNSTEFGVLVVSCFSKKIRKKRHELSRWPRDFVLVSDLVFFIPGRVGPGWARSIFMYLYHHKSLLLLLVVVIMVTVT